MSKEEIDLFSEYAEKKAEMVFMLAIVWLYHRCQILPHRYGSYKL